MPKCKECGKELCRGDMYGYYCDNQNCEAYDMDIEVLEIDEPQH